MYHEKQQPGSMLCAEHALNNLLREPILNSKQAMELIMLCYSILEGHYVSWTPAFVKDGQAQQ